MNQENIPLQLNEEIKPIQDYEGLYSITSFGRVWSHRRIDALGRKWGGVFLKFSLDKDGYLMGALYRKRYRRNIKLHRLIATYYIPNPQNLPEVNHKDGNKQNNFAGTAANNYTDGNLEWCTGQENMNHASINKLYTYKKHSKFYGVSLYKNITHRNKPWAAGVRENRKYKYIGSFRTELEAAQAYNNYIIRYNLDRPLNEV